MICRDAQSGRLKRINDQNVKYETPNLGVSTMFMIYTRPDSGFRFKQCFLPFTYQFLLLCTLYFYLEAACFYFDPDYIFKFKNYDNEKEIEFSLDGINFGLAYYCTFRCKRSEREGSHEKVFKRIAKSADE